MATKTLKVVDLRLDGENPRHDPTTGEREVIEALLAKDGAKIAVLAEDIATYGLNPLDVFLVLEEAGPIYTVIEGNRRMVSLKLLADPSLTARSTYASRFTELKKKQTSPIAEVLCHLVATRDAAKHWQEVRHGGEQAGRGVIPWDPTASARFFGRQGTQVAKAASVIDAWKKAYPANTTLQADLETTRRDRSSTLGRFISDPDVRHGFGLVVEGSKVTAHYSSAELEAAISRVANDMATGRKTVAAVDSKALRKTYLEELRDVLPNSAQRKAKASPFAPLRRTTPPPAPTPAPPILTKKTATARPAPSRLFEGVILTKLPSRVRNILGELQRLDVGLFANASAVLLRVVIELAVTEVHLAKGWPLEVVDKKGQPHDIPLRKLIEKCLDGLDPIGKDKKWQPVRIGLNVKDGPFTTSTLNAWLHNPRFNPVPSDLRSTADNYSDFLAALDTLV
jgi:hypothetical protein